MDPKNLLSEVVQDCIDDGMSPDAAQKLTASAFGRLKKQGLVVVVDGQAMLVDDTLLAQMQAYYDEHGLPPE